MHDKARGQEQIILPVVRTIRKGGHLVVGLDQAHREPLAYRQIQTASNPHHECVCSVTLAGTSAASMCTTKQALRKWMQAI